MDPAKFERIREEGHNMLTALFAGKLLGVDMPGDLAYYNAYLRGSEVVVVGYQYPEGDHVLTKAIAVLVDEDVFTDLRVDGESGRYIDGSLGPPKVM